MKIQNFSQVLTKRKGDGFDCLLMTLPQCLQVGYDIFANVISLPKSQRFQFWEALKLLISMASIFISLLIYKKIIRAGMLFMKLF
jgi:hypothetical protein